MPFLKHVILLFALTTISQAHIFTSSDGVRKIEASITSYDEKSKIVSIIRIDGKSFNSKLSTFSAEDQVYILKWLEGTKENYLYVGKEYPGHLQMYLKILNSGGIGYGQTILYRPGLAPVIIGNGPTPFLAWVDGYNKLDQAYRRFNAISINFDLIEKNWRASISFRTGRTLTQSTGVTIVPTGNLYGLASVSGPILYQQPQRVVIMGKDSEQNSLLILPRGPAPVFINPYLGSMNMNGIGVNAKGYSGYSRGNGISIRINR